MSGMIHVYPLLSSNTKKMSSIEVSYWLRNSKYMYHLSDLTSYANIQLDSASIVYEDNSDAFQCRLL
jgi:hypothetical protein